MASAPARHRTASARTERPLSVGLNLVYLRDDSGGSGTYARELIRALHAVEPETRVTAFVSRAAPRSLLEADWDGAIDWVVFPFEESGGRPWTGPVTVASQWAALPALARRRRLDVVHGLANIVPPVAPGVATVVTLLDLIWLRFPNTMARRATLGMKLLAPLCARRADRVIAISHAGKRDLVDSIGLPPGKVDVTHLGVRVNDDAAAAPASELRAKLDLADAPVMLCVAQKREHKNLEALVRALAMVPDGRLQLVLPGSPTPYEDRLRAVAAEVGVADRVKLPGWLEDAELEALYRAASCFVLPSFEEGFGIPILEAMGRGVPVACSNTTSLPEVAGDAALLFDPHDPSGIAASITRLTSDRELARTLIERGRARCEVFTWEATARATLDTYRRALAGA
jgi:glycosyltransferase involved in cell wall biosynthesis